jgi:hypothetical protein
MKSTTRIAMFAVVIVAGFAALSACGSGTPEAGATGQSSTSSTTSSATTPPALTTTRVPTSPDGGSSQPPAGERCSTDELSGHLVEGDPGAGQRYAELVLTNTSGQTCEIFGYGGAQLVAPDGSDLPTDLERDDSTPPQTVTLSPGDSAQSLLHWSVVVGEGDTAGPQCQPSAATLAVIPPDETTSLDVPWQLGPVCERGRLDQQAYVAA